MTDPRPSQERLVTSSERLIDYVLATWAVDHPGGKTPERLAEDMLWQLDAELSYRADWHWLLAS